MNKPSLLKEQILNHLLTQLNQKAETAKTAIQSAKESRNNNTKSSAGDKFETGREMMQMEIDKNEAQLGKALKLKSELLQINIQKRCEKVEFGSLVFTSEGIYFISIGIGKLIVNNDPYFAISLASPIGKLLHNKVVGDKIQFQKREFEINYIV